MTDTAMGPAAGSLPRFRVREERDRHVIDAALADDRAFGAYAIANLELGLFEHARYWIAEGAHGVGVLMHSDSRVGRAMVTAGDAAAVDALLSLHPGPYTTYLATAAPDHVDIIKRTYTVAGDLEMQRMAVTAASFTPVPGEVRRLRREDARALNMLYSAEGAPTGYSGEHIEQGVYYGAYEGGRLVSVAGTHVVAPNAGVAVVGNVFTHPGYRGAGLATRVTSAVTAELFERRGCALVALTVNPANMPAVRAYRRIGYQPGAPVVEARLRRRDPTGINAGLRRWVARRRAHGGEPGDENAPGRGTH